MGRGGLGAHGHQGAEVLVAGGRAQHHAGQHADELADAQDLHLAHTLGDVALADVGQFVGQDAGHLGFVLHLENEPGEDEDVAGRSGKGVDGVVVDDADSEGEGLGRHGPGQPIHQTGHVVVDLGVLNKRHPGSDHDVEFFAEFPFILEVKRQEGGLDQGRGEQGDDEPEGDQGRRQPPGCARPAMQAWGVHGRPIRRTGREGKRPAALVKNP